VGHHTEAFVGIDTSKLRNAVAIAEGGRGGEVRFLGEFPATEAGIRKLVAKLASKYRRLTFCYEAGPTGYWLYRLIKSLGHECVVVAPSLIPKKPGERVKTNRRDAMSLAKLLRGRAHGCPMPVCRLARNFALQARARAPTPNGMLKLAQEQPMWLAVTRNPNSTLGERWACAYIHRARSECVETVTLRNCPVPTWSVW